MRNLERVIQHMARLEDRAKSDRVAAIVRAVRQRQRRFQEAIRSRQSDLHAEDGQARRTV